MQMLFMKMALPILVLLAESLFAAAAIGIPVWPLPSHYSLGNNVLWIAENLQFTYKALNNRVTLHSSC